MAANTSPAPAAVSDLTTGRVLAGHIEHARGHWGRFRGLMLRRDLAQGTGLWIEPCRSIHMMFMRFPIDAVFIDRTGTVTRVASNLRPWTGFAMGGRGAHAVIELPAGAATGVLPGHRIEVSE